MLYLWLDSCRVFFTIDAHGEMLRCLMSECHTLSLPLPARASAYNPSLIRKLRSNERNTDYLGIFDTTARPFRSPILALSLTLQHPQRQQPTQAPKMPSSRRLKIAFVTANRCSWNRQMSCRSLRNACKRQKLERRSLNRAAASSERPESQCTITIHSFSISIVHN